jgi:acyl transferase domain-containing protein
VYTLQKGQNQAIDILKTAGQLFLNGVSISFDAINGTGNCLKDLPSYPWNYSTQNWRESRVSKEWRLRKFAHHELLGSRVIGSNDLEPSWRNILSLENSPWLCDHKFSGAIVFPSAGYIAAVTEAIRQLSGKVAYSFRDIFIKSALFLDEDHDVEIMTILKPVRLTDVLDSAWFEFSISSYTEKGWTKHCTGQVIGVEETSSPGIQIKPYHRQVSSPNHYEALRECGLDYGPHFQGLKNVTADPNSRRATGTLTSEMNMDELKAFSIHPTIIDKALQLITVAATRGLTRAVDRLAVPISFERVYLASSDSNEISANAVLTATTYGNAFGHVFAHADKKSLLEVEGLKTFVVDAEAALSDPSKAVWFASTNWKPDIEFLPMSTLLPVASPRRVKCFELLNMAGTLYLIRMWHLIESITPAKPHLTKYKQWVEDIMRAFRVGEHSAVPETQEWMTLPFDRLCSLIDEKEASDDITALQDRGTILSFLRRLVDSTPEILRGQQAALDILMEDSSLENYYSPSSDPTDCAQFLSLIGHSRPRMRVLEIGGGTGGFTSSVLQGLETPAGAMMYSEYVFTDISPGFFPRAKERFNRFPGIVFKKLDITKDPIEQGFGGFDLVVASNVCLESI